MPTRISCCFASILLSFLFCMTSLQAEDLTSQLKRNEELKTQMLSVQQEMGTLSQSISERLKQYFPKPGTEFGDKTWIAQVSRGNILIYVTEGRLQRLARITLHYHVEEAVTGESIGLHGDFMGMPSMTVENTKLWLLAGRMEVRIEGIDDAFKDDTVLQDLAKSLDLKGLAGL